MGFWEDFFGLAGERLLTAAEVAALSQEELEALPRLVAMRLPKRGAAAWHRDRFANALPQYRVMLERGETTRERLAELERWLEYYTAIAAAEAGAGIPVAASDGAADDREEEIAPWAP